MGKLEARKALERARKQWERAATATWDPADPEEAVTWAFYAYENCVVAIAESTATTWRKLHSDKATLATKFYEEGLVTRDVGPVLEDLNGLRKQVAYGEVFGDLATMDLEEMVSDLESPILEVAVLVGDEES